MEFTLREAAQVLDPPVTEWQLRQLVTALRVQPAGRRRTGHAGRPVSTYDYAELAKLHEVLVPFLPIPGA